jgi:hypothetical protein
MALGGFLGSDPILTVDELAAKIRAGEVRFFLLDGRGGPGGPGGPNGSALASWVRSTCTAVPSSALGASVNQPGQQTDGQGTGGESASGSGIYDCAGLQGAA